MAKVTIMREIEILKESLINAPIIWKGDYPYFIHPITDGVPRLEPKVLKAVIELSVPLIDWGSVDMILGIEAMGLPLMAPLSMRTGIPMVIGRKRQYRLDGEIEINQETDIMKKFLIFLFKYIFKSFMLKVSTSFFTSNASCTIHY